MVHSRCSALARKTPGQLRASWRAAISSARSRRARERPRFAKALRSVPYSRGTFLCFWNCAARMQTVDVFCAEAQLVEDLLIVLAKLRTAPCRHFGNTVYLHRTADRRA